MSVQTDEAVCSNQGDWDHPTRHVWGTLARTQDTRPLPTPCTPGRLAFSLSRTLMPRYSPGHVQTASNPESLR